MIPELTCSLLVTLDTCRLQHVTNALDSLVSTSAGAASGGVASGIKKVAELLVPVLHLRTMCNNLQLLLAPLHAPAARETGAVGGAADVGSVWLPVQTAAQASLELLRSQLVRALDRRRAADEVRGERLTHCHSK